MITYSHEERDDKYLESARSYLAESRVASCIISYGLSFLAIATAKSIFGCLQDETLVVHNGDEPGTLESSVRSISTPSKMYHDRCLDWIFREERPVELEDARWVFMIDHDVIFDNKNEVTMMMSNWVQEAMSLKTVPWLAAVVHPTGKMKTYPWMMVNNAADWNQHPHGWSTLRTKSDFFDTGHIMFDRLQEAGLFLNMSGVDLPNHVHLSHGAFWSKLHPRAKESKINASREMIASLIRNGSLRLNDDDWGIFFKLYPEAAAHVRSII